MAKENADMDEFAGIFAIATRLAASKGEEVKVYDVTARTTLTDYAIVVSGASQRRLKALTKEAREALSESGYTVSHVEGAKDSSWFLVDAGTVIVHIFAREERLRVALDDLYQDLPLRIVDEDDIIAYTKGKAVKTAKHKGKLKSA